MFSDAKYNASVRTYLVRVWDTHRPLLDIVMYYPSTADAETDDTTIQRCRAIAAYNGYGGIRVFNVHPDVVQDIQPVSNEVVVAWGNKLSPSISQDICRKLAEKFQLTCFKTLQNGCPGLPTRLPVQTLLCPYTFF